MRKKNVLVIGGAGYIGSHMVKHLLGLGYPVIIVDNLSTGHSELLTGGNFFKGSISDARFLDKIFSTHEIGAVMHFAACSIVGESVGNPLKYYRNNLSGTLELLSAMVRYHVKYLIFSSTAAVYGEPVEIPITENHQTEPTNPYGATKIAVEKMIDYCDVAHGLKYISLRYFNAAGADASGIIGECHDPETHLIPLVLKAALGEIENIKIFGTNYPTRDGTCIRDYIHVNDLASAHMLSLEALFSGKSSSVYNLGNSRGYSVRELIDTAGRVTGRLIPVVDSERRPGDPAVLVASSEKIKTELGYSAQYEDLETIIKTAWVWHQKAYLQKPL